MCGAGYVISLTEFNWLCQERTKDPKAAEQSAPQEKPSDGSMQLLVKTRCGKVITVDSLKPSDSIGHVKTKVLCAEGGAHARARGAFECPRPG